MKRAFWLGATGVVAALTAASVASAATLGGVTSPDLDTSAAAPSPAFYIFDHFDSVGTAALGGTSIALSPTGDPADLASVNMPAWTADAGWVVDAHLAEAKGVGLKVAHFPFTSQNGYVATSFEVFALNASAGVVITYDPAAGTGVAVMLKRAGGAWHLAMGTIAAGAFTETSFGVLPLTGGDRPTGGELRARIQEGTVIGSYAGIDYVSHAVGTGTYAGLVSLTPNAAAGYHYLAAAKTP